MIIRIEQKSPERNENTLNENARAHAHRNKIATGVINDRSNQYK